MKTELIDLLHKHYYPTMHESIADTTLIECADQILSYQSEEIEKGLLTDEERMKVYIPCETCSFTRDVFSVRCLDCFVKHHIQAQLQKILALLK